MIRALIAGTAFFLALFALGFVLGTLRVVFVAPRFGELAATFAEVPVMLIAAFFAYGCDPLGDGALVSGTAVHIRNTARRDTLWTDGGRAMGGVGNASRVARPVGPDHRRASPRACRQA